MERIKLNLIPSGVAPIVHLSQYDDGRKFGIDLFEGESVYVLDGTETLTVNSRKPDGHVVVLTVTNTGTSSLDVDTVEQLTAVHGVSYAKLQIVKGSVTIATLPFLIDVSRDPLENGDPSESFIQNLRTQIAEGVAEEVAEQYDSANVIFDNEPTSGHGIGYTVTSEGIKTAIDNAFDYDNTASGSIVHITDGADNIPVKSLVSQIVAVESGNEQPKSPDNPYTISGFDNGIITRCGKNLLNNPDITTTGGSYVINNVNVPMVAGKYVLSFNFSGTSNSSSLRIDDEDGTAIFTTTKTITNGHNEYLINLQSKGSFVKLFSNAVGTYTNFQIELGNSSTTYEAYNGNTYTFTFGQTVYGGHFDNKGNLVVTHKEINLSTLSWSATTLGSQNVWRTSLPNDCKGYADNFVPTNILCEQYEPNSVDNMYSGYSGVSLRASGSYIYCSRTDNNEPQGKLIAELITPTSLTITSQDIPTLLGENNIFSNCGDVEVNYYTSKSNDILEFIDSEIGKKNGTNIPIEENSQDSIKDYVDNEVSSVSIEGLSDTEITDASEGQVLTFDGDNWVNTNQIVVKYEEIDVTLDASGEGTLFNSVKFVVGLKDIPSDQLYVAYVSYINVGRTMVKAFSRSAIAFSSQSNVSSIRKVGVYYLDNIATP